MDFSRDLVVLNSVVQYFPTPEYLREVVDALTQIPGVRRLFFGDVRSYPLNRDFLAARALHDLAGKATKNDIRLRIAEMEEREEELLVDPAFFHRAGGSHARSDTTRRDPAKEDESCKRTEFVSVCGYLYTYATRKSRHSPVYAIDANDWVDFKALEMDRQSLLHLLQSS